MARKSRSRQQVAVNHKRRERLLFPQSGGKADAWMRPSACCGYLNILHYSVQGPVRQAQNLPAYISSGRPWIPGIPYPYSRSIY